MHSGLTSIRVVSTRASARCWGWTFMTSPVTVVCGVLAEPTERVTVLVKVTGGQHSCWKNTNTIQAHRQLDTVEVKQIKNCNVM